MLISELPKTWRSVLEPETSKSYFKKLTGFLEEKYKFRQSLPKPSNIFKAFRWTPLNKVRVVIVGQDPYPNPKQALGVAFGCARRVPLPASLKNICCEVEDDFGIPPISPTLRGWASQGVLLLNRILTVDPYCSLSHEHKGWEQFTDATLDYLGSQERPLVFLLWGRYAQEKEKFISKTKHTILRASSPEPLSVHNGFFGCKHFTQTNKILSKYGDPIDWSL